MNVIENLKYDFKGKWINKEGYGWELKIEEYKEIEPDGKDRYALISYLQSGLFDGIGEKIADKDIKSFDDETLKSLYYIGHIQKKLKQRSMVKVLTD